MGEGVSEPGSEGMVLCALVCDASCLRETIAKDVQEQIGGSQTGEPAYFGGCGNEPRQKVPWMRCVT